MQSFNLLLEEGLLDSLLPYLVKPTEKENEYKLNITSDKESENNTDDEESIVKNKTKILYDTEKDEREK